ncbi:MAG: HD domain-containing phosphohydrolase, partial [Dermatophilaceae bacterium]
MPRAAEGVLTVLARSQLGKRTVASDERWHVCTKRGHAEGVFRLMALLAGLAGVTDLGAGGQPDESLRRCVLATRLAHLTGCSEVVVRDVQQVALLGHIGCLAWSHETGNIWGDDVAVTHAALMADPASAAHAARLVVPMVAAATGRSRPGVAVTMLRTSRHTNREAPVATCQVAEAAGRRLAFSPLVVASLGHVTAGWNGSGYPPARGEHIPLPARLMHVAMVAVLFADGFGLEAATAEVRRRAGGHLDPELAAACGSAMAKLCEGLDSEDPFSMVLDLEPDPVARVDGAGLADIARVCGELVDLKSPWLHGHSSTVAELAASAATEMGLPEAEQVRVAGYLHDVGRAGLPSRLWGLARPWTAAERDQVQLHVYYTERVLARVPELGAIAGLAGL